MAVITVRISEKIKKKMSRIDINWSEYVRSAIMKKIDEGRRNNLAKAVLINERLRRKSRGEMSSEEIIRKFRDERRAACK